jgi:integrase
VYLRPKCLLASTADATSIVDQGLVFAGETGSLFNPSNLRNRSLKRIKARSGVRENLRFHDLRHRCARLLLGEGVNAKVVSEKSDTPR